MMTTQLMLRAQRGISIVELLAVITILSILAVIVTPVAQVVVTREIELDMMQHLRSIRRGIDIFHESIVRCWECDESNLRKNERCMSCTSSLAGVLCQNSACPSHALPPSPLSKSDFNSRSLDRCFNPACAVPLDTIMCYECGATLAATDMYSGRLNVSCPTCGGDVDKYGDAGFPTSFQEMYKLNTLRIAHSYNPVTSNSEDWDIVIYKSPPEPGTNISEPEFRVNGVDVLSYIQNPTTLQYSVSNGYPRKSGTKGLLRNGEGYVMESWEWKSLLDENGFFSPDKWEAYATQHGITVYDTKDIDNWRSYASLLDEFSAEAIAPIMPSIYDVHFPVTSKRNRLTLDGKKVYSDL